MVYSKQDMQDIMLAVDVGYEINSVAAAYVQQFNRVSHFTIIEWSTRNPTDKEIENSKQYLIKGIEVFKVADEWFTRAKTFSNSLVEKRIFMLVTDRYQKVPDHLYKSRMSKLDIKPIEVAKDVGE